MGSAGRILSLRSCTDRHHVTDFLLTSASGPEQTPATPDGVSALEVLADILRDRRRSTLM